MERVTVSLRRECPTPGRNLIGRSCSCAKQLISTMSVKVRTYSAKTYDFLRRRPSHRGTTMFNCTRSKPTHRGFKEIRI